MAAVLSLGRPALLASPGVEPNHVAIGCGVQHDVLINRERLSTGGRALPQVGKLPFVLPEQPACRGVQRVYGGAGHDHAHAVLNERDGLGRAGSQSARPSQAELAYILTIDLLSGLKRWAS